MRINCAKKILSVLLTVILGVISSSAMADIQYYDFSWTGTNGLEGGLLREGTITGGQITVDTSFGNLITNVTGTISYTGMTGGAIDSYSGGGALNYFAGPTSTSNPFFTGPGGVPGTMELGSGSEFYTFSYTGSLSTNQYALNNGDVLPAPQGIAVVAASGGAPEIDGSLFPKMALLLGCLYFLFSRKNVSTRQL